MKDDVKQAIEKINALVADADDRAIYLIKKEARRILREDPNLDEFIMAMGSCFFTIKEGGAYDPDTMTDEEWEEWMDSDEYVYSYKGIIDNDPKHPFQKEFFDMVDDFNEQFSVCGYPVRFKAETKEVHNWGDTRKDPIKWEKLPKKKAS